MLAKVKSVVDAAVVEANSSLRNASGEMLRSIVRPPMRSFYTVGYQHEHVCKVPVG